MKDTPKKHFKMKDLKIKSNLLKRTFFPPGIHNCDEPATKSHVLRPIFMPFFSLIPENSNIPYDPHFLRPSPKGI